MAASSSNVIALALLIPFLFIMIQCQAQSPAAPAPAPSGPVNLTAILEKAGQYTTFIKLLTSTQVGNQVNNQANSSTEGMTVFAPTDNAFNNLKAGALNGLSTQEQVQLVLYHVLPKLYTLESFQTVSNPVRTQATGDDGSQWGINFSTQANQVNVSSGIVETQLNNALRQQMPLAVYQLDKVLLPEALFGTKAPKASPAPAATNSSSNSSSSPAEGPASEDNSSGASLINLSWGSMVGLAIYYIIS